MELGKTNDALGQTTTLISNGAVPAALQVSNPGGVSFASALQAVGGDNGVRAFARRVAVRGSGQLPGATGVRGEAEGHGVTGFSTGGITDGGVFGQGLQVNGNGVIGQADNGTLAFGVWGKSTSGFAGVFTGKVAVTGQLTKSGGGFKIDHPLDPENKYLLSLVRRVARMMNIYNGNVTTDQDGDATLSRCPITSRHSTATSATSSR